MFKGSTVLVLGAGISGQSVALTLQRQGAMVILSDCRPEEALNKDFSALRSAGVKLVFGPQTESLLTTAKYMVLSPGISIKEPLVEAAKARGITVMSEVEVAYRLCSGPILGVTGTNGKTTTTTLIGEMFKQAGRKYVVGGNIGPALSAKVVGLDNETTVVAEISSFQLEGTIDFRPRVAAILNVTPDHIDRHGSLAEYIATKAKIFANQTAADYLVLNYDDETVRKYARPARAKVMFFSRRVKLPAGIYLAGGKLVLDWQGEIHPFGNINDLKIKGRHNIENAMAAAGVAFLGGVKVSDIAVTLREFPGVEHRIEPVTTINGVEYFNDSKATNPDSSIKALESFGGHIILIAGGRDKHTDLTALMTLVRQKVDHLLLLGEAAERFQQAAIDQGVNNIHIVGNMAAAVQLAYDLARAPQLVLLSPACASYDMFSGYEERGRIFKKLVYALA